MYPCKAITVLSAVMTMLIFVLPLIVITPSDEIEKVSRPLLGF